MLLWPSQECSPSSSHIALVHEQILQLLESEKLQGQAVHA